MTAHLGGERLHELADAGGLPERASRDAELHLAECARCREALEALRAVDAAARALPASIEPPESLWGTVSASIARSSGTAPPASAVVPAQPRPVRLTAPRRTVKVETRWLAAAALVLMTMTAAATVWLMRGDTAPQVAAGGTPAASAIPAAFAATERAYLHDVAQLESLLAAQRARLSPATIAVVERALGTIDAAIAEARLALIADPANQELAELLAAGYRHKVELLRRAAEATGTA